MSASEPNGTTGLIIAAGMGSRMAALTDSKPLLPVGPRPLIEWVMAGARRAGVTDFVVVTGCNEAKLRARVESAAATHGWSVRFAHNDRWREPNGLSVQAAAALIAGPFFLLMSDHLFDPAILELLAARPPAEGEATLAVDTRVQANPWVDMDDVTRVLCREGRIRAIGKGLAEYNAFDTGIFRCTPGLFAALAESGRRGDFSLSGGMRVLAETGRARALAIGDRFWLDVDDEAALRKAQAWLAGGRS